MRRRQAMLNILDTALDSTGKTWLDEARLKLDALEGDLETVTNQIIFYFGSAARKLGATPVSGSLPSGFPADLHGECDLVFLNHWTVTDAARVIFITDIMAKNRFNPDEFFQLCYRYSDDAERTSLLKGLALLKLSAQSTDFIIDTARTNSLSLFSALVYENPWPAIKFPTASFNQLVLKSLFMRLDISHIIGLRAKCNPELGRMTADYVQERIDADRPIPPSIWLVVDVTGLGKDGINAWLETLNSEDEQTRLLAGKACKWQPELPLAM